MITGVRLAYLFNFSKTHPAPDHVRRESVELLSGYQRYADYKRALDHIRGVLIARYSLAIHRGDEVSQRNHMELVNYIDNLLQDDP